MLCLECNFLLVNFKLASSALKPGPVLAYYTALQAWCEEQDLYTNKYHSTMVMERAMRPRSKAVAIYYNGHAKEVNYITFFTQYNVNFVYLISMSTWIFMSWYYILHDSTLISNSPFRKAKSMFPCTAAVFVIQLCMNFENENILKINARMSMLLTLFGYTGCIKCFKKYSKHSIDTNNSTRTESNWQRTFRIWEK